MHSFLFSIARPDVNSPKINDWSSLVDNALSTAEPTAKVEVLGKGAWLFLSSDSLILMGKLIQESKAHQFAYRIFVIDSAKECKDGEIFSAEIA